ncbi:growth/differentiation factor 8-like [Lytechinus pictus]|uniref:growth/differentiation factor 8-like n=1 Tax=Lytechinus pictus TaxID=7653 RepID=UPI0030B9B26F
MAQLYQYVFLALFIADFICLTIASYPPSWRRNDGIIPMSAHHHHHQQHEEIPAENNSTRTATIDAEDGTEDPELTSEDNQTPPPEFSTCPPCWMQEQQKQFRIESIKKRILEKLQLTRVPNITGPPPKNPAINNLLNNYPQFQNNPSFQSDSPQAEYHDPAPAQLERILIFAKRPLQTQGIASQPCCYFNVAEKIVGYHVSSAKLYFYVAPAKVIQNTLHLMTIKMITARPHPEGHTKLRLVAKIKVQLSLRVGAWKSVDFTNVVQGWAAEPETNLGIVLELTDDAGNSVLITETSTEEPRRPFLQLRLDDDRRVRTKRQSERMCSEDRQERECCMFPLIVDFQQFGWDWIIAPRTYDANYCFGSCPDHYFYRYPHTQLISQMDRMAVAGPCCSPSKMTSISLLIFDEDGDIRNAELQDMAVQTCDCA